MRTLRLGPTHPQVHLQQELLGGIMWILGGHGHVDHSPLNFCTV